MKISAAHNRKLFLLVFFVVVLAGCDQMEKVASGVGRATKSLSDKVSRGVISKDDKNDEKTEGGTDPATVVDTAGEIEEEAETATDSDSTDDSESIDDAKDGNDDSGSNDDADSNDSDSKGRNVEQYPRLPRNVTWKPVSAASGDNLTIVLWGAGGGETNYEAGSLRIEHNHGTKYPRTYVRRDDPDNGERAPKFYFDVQGGWFVGKDPVLFWNLGAYRVVSPERRQGKHEGED